VELLPSLLDPTDADAASAAVFVGCCAVCCTPAAELDVELIESAALLVELVALEEAEAAVSVVEVLATPSRHSSRRRRRDSPACGTGCICAVDQVLLLTAFTLADAGASVPSLRRACPQWTSPLLSQLASHQPSASGGCISRGNRLRSRPLLDHCFGVHAAGEE
jgi:hypothetical protein